MIVKNYMIQRGLWNSQGLTTTEKVVALCLVHFRNEKTNECVVAQRLIAKRTHLTRRAVSKALALLQDKMIVAMWPARDDMLQYDFFLPAFSSINSENDVHTPPQEKTIKFLADDGCIPAWEATKPPLDNYPPETEMAKSEFEALLHLCWSMPEPQHVEPWPLGAIDGRVQDAPGDDPDDLMPNEWATHKQRASELVGVII